MDSGSPFGYSISTQKFQWSAASHRMLLRLPAWQFVCAGAAKILAVPAVWWYPSAVAGKSCGGPLTSLSLDLFLPEEDTEEIPKP
jgi:hypothetical protein